MALIFSRPLRMAMFPGLLPVKSTLLNASSFNIMQSLTSNERGEVMAVITVRNLPDAVHRALRVRAAHHGRSTEAEIRDILETVALPPERVKLGSLLTSIAREAGGMSDGEVEHFNQLRDKTPAEPMRFE
jgi:antitoxin FitA